MPRPVPLLLLLAIAACGGTGDRPPPATLRPPATTATTGAATATTWPPGNPAVHRRIAGLTDCVELQDELDSALATAELHARGDVLRNVAVAYATAAAERMDALGC